MDIELWASVWLQKRKNLGNHAIFLNLIFLHPPCTLVDQSQQGCAPLCTPLSINPPLIVYVSFSMQFSTVEECDFDQQFLFDEYVAISHRYDLKRVSLKSYISVLSSYIKIELFCHVHMMHYSLLNFHSVFLDTLYIGHLFLDSSTRSHRRIIKECFPYTT